MTNVGYGFRVKVYENWKILFFLFIPILFKSKDFNKIERFLKILKFKLSPKRELSAWYFKKTGEKLDFNNPRTFNEKMQWMKLYDSTPLKSKLADKYEVRDWVKEKIGEEYLIPILGVWDRFDDINFDKLPQQFVLKCNHGCGYNIIVPDKNKFNKNSAREKINNWLNEDFAYKNGFELHYSAIQRKIIAEEYIEGLNKSAIDYKFICFDGDPVLCWITDKYKDIHERSFYSLPEWNKEDIEYLDANNVQCKTLIEKPKQLDKILKICNILSKGFPLVRVDIYLINEKIYFGEMTFTSSSGIAKFVPDELNYTLGDKIVLPKKRNKG